MRQSALVQAKRYMKRRRFDKAITVLESRYEIYARDFEYNLTLGTAYLYAGDFGAASTWFQKARNIKLLDNNLKLGQAALFLRRGDTNRAIQYYMEILDNEPSHKIAAKALDFIKNHGDYETICNWIDTGKMEQFYPQIGVNPLIIAGIAFPVVACVLGCILAAALVSNGKTETVNPYAGTRRDLSALMLTVDETRNVQSEELSSVKFEYILSAEEVASSYEKACKYFQNYDDNSAQIEVNRILSSNAALSVKHKAQELEGFLNKSPGFDSIKRNCLFGEVSENPSLYLNCYVSWSGRPSNVRDDGKTFDLLVGYETMEKVDGVVTVSFENPQTVEFDKPVKVLGKISSSEEGNKLRLEGRSIFQGVSDTLTVGNM